MSTLSFYFFDRQRNGTLPYRATEGSAGYELVTHEPIVLRPGIVTKVHTNITVDIPLGFYGKIEMKSRYATLGAIVLGGVIDSDYKNMEVVCMLSTIGDAIEIPAGKSCAQMLILPCLMEGFHNRTVRTGGFGSTGG